MFSGNLLKNKCLSLVIKALNVQMKHQAPKKANELNNINSYRYKCKVVWYGMNAQSCLILCVPMDCNPLGSSVYGILQASILEWVAVSSSRESS